MEHRGYKYRNYFWENIQWRFVRDDQEGTEPAGIRAKWEQINILNKNFMLHNHICVWRTYFLLCNGKEHINFQFRDNSKKKKKGFSFKTTEILCRVSPVLYTHDSECCSLSPTGRWALQASWLNIENEQDGNLQTMRRFLTSGVPTTTVYHKLRELACLQVLFLSLINSWSQAASFPALQRDHGTKNKNTQRTTRYLVMLFVLNRYWQSH